MKIARWYWLIWCCLFQTTASAQLPPIGQWREHLNYQQTIQVVKGDRIYCATKSALFALSADNEIQRYSKVTGLNDIGISTIGWDAATQQIIVAYQNSNIDLIKGSIIKNMGDIKLSNIAGNKTINHIYTQNGIAYLSSGLGIIVADLSRYEIKDTWIIGNNGGQTKVNALTRDNNFIYAATDEGLKRASLNANNLADYHNWLTISGNNGLPAGNYQSVLHCNNSLIALSKDSVFIQTGNSWSLLYTDAGWPIIQINSTDNKIQLCQRTITGNARVLVLNTNGIVEKQLGQNGVISLPRSAISDNNAVWVADAFGGLSRFTAVVERFIPNGPPGIATGEMVSDGEQLYVAAGSVNEAWNYQFNRDGIFDFSNSTWNYKGFYNTPLLDSVLDFITVAIDSRNKAYWAGSYGGGLVQFGKQRISVYKSYNSTLRAAIGDPGSIRVSGLCFDSKNNLWISNYGAPQNLQVRKADSSWQSFTIPFNHLENAVAQIIVDDIDQVWIMSPKGNGLFCFNYGNDLTLTNDDKWKYYRQGTGNGNLPSNNVYSILKDKNGFIWVGTDRGIAIIQCAETVFGQGSCDAIQPIVQQDRFAGLLFKDEVVQCMAVDGANRKWIGTRNGVWLIAPNGDKIIYRFTTDNSPLLSNDVRKMTIDPVTGEVFMATFNGLCSFRSTATEGTTTNNNVLVFPNPVAPGYNGTIAIRGLVNNALVKITEPNGRLVFQTRALGGQAIWNGKTYTGAKVASGIYLVLVRDDSGKETIATKIVLTSGR